MPCIGRAGMAGRGCFVRSCLCCNTQRSHALHGTHPYMSPVQPTPLLAVSCTASSSVPLWFDPVLSTAMPTAGAIGSTGPMGCMP